eukprot:1543330-Pyramimonas_sp.AAC.1
MPRNQQQVDSLLERMKSYAHIAERTPVSIGGISSHGHRAETFHAEANSGQSAMNVWNDDPQPTKTTTLLAQNGGPATGSQDSWARYQGPSAMAAPAQAITLVGSTGQPAESHFDSGTDTDTSSDDETNALDYSDMPAYLTEEQQAQWLFLGHQKHKRRW